jgi:hypothetical protein
MSSQTGPGALTPNFPGFDLKKKILYRLAILIVFGTASHPFSLSKHHVARVTRDISVSLSGRCYPFVTNWDDWCNFTSRNANLEHGSGS